MIYAGDYPWETSIEEIEQMPEFMAKKKDLIIVTRGENI